MSEIDSSGPSLLLAQKDAAQREHSKHTHAQAHAAHKKRLSHQRFHRAPQGTPPSPEEDSTSDVVTISIIQQINVDANGNTLGIETIQTHLSSIHAKSSANPLPASIPAEATPTYLEPSSIPSNPTLQEPPLGKISADPATAIPIFPTDSQIPSTVAGPYSTTIPGLDAASVTTSLPLVPSTEFPTLTAELNSTTLILSSSSLSQTYANSSSTRFSRSSLTSSRSSSLFSSSTTSSSSYLSPSSTYLAAPSNGGTVAAGTGIIPSSATGSSTAETDSSSSSSSDDSPTPTPVVIGGVVGSLAGAAFLIIALLYIIRWRKKTRGMLSLGSGTDSGDATRDQPSMQPSGGAMTEYRAHGFVVPAALAALTGYSKRFSQKTEETVSPTASNERGFYRVSGRKLPSVLQTGGDGYGGGLPHDSTMSGSSFYTDSQGFYGGGGPSSPPLPLSLRESAGGIPYIRPSPARTPTQEQSPFAFDSQGTPSPPAPPRRPDNLGRSHVSQDGSHASRFTEEV